MIVAFQINASSTYPEKENVAALEITVNWKHRRNISPKLKFIKWETLIAT